MKPASDPAGGASGVAHALLRPPSMVMRLARMGAFHPTRVSFVRTLVRRKALELWRIERERFGLDANGYDDSADERSVAAAVGASHAETRANIDMELIPYAEESIIHLPAATMAASRRVAAGTIGT